MERLERDFLLLHSNVLTADGSIGEDLQRRLNFVVDGFSRGLFSVETVIPAGRNGKRDKEYVDKTGITQAHVIEAYLREHGVTEPEIWKEDEGSTTYACIENAYKRLILPRGYGSGIVVSTAEHLARIMNQTYQVFHPGLYGNCVFMGPSIEDDAKRGEFLRRELGSFARFTQPELAAMTDRLCPAGTNVDPY